jgi:phosphoglycolate phosphatase
MMPHPLVIFDLDGTLADSLPWFLRNVNSIAERFSFL